MAAITPVYLYHNQIGNLKEDFIQIPSTNTETAPSVRGRMANVLGAHIVAVNNTTDTDQEYGTLTITSNVILLSAVTSEIEYRIHAWGV